MKRQETQDGLVSESIKRPLEATSFGLQAHSAPSKRRGEPLRCVKQSSARAGNQQDESMIDGQSHTSQISTPSLSGESRSHEISSTWLASGTFSSAAPLQQSIRTQVVGAPTHRFNSTNHVARPEICFGVLDLEISVLSSGTVTDERKVVSLRPLGEIVQLHCQTTSRYIGFCESHALSKLSKACTIHLEATLVTQTRKSAVRRSVEKVPSNAMVSKIRRVLVCGMSAEKYTVANMLSDLDLFLQHPLASELQDRWEYDNPQYLRRPESPMPDLESLSIDVDDMASEPEQPEIRRLFDTATDSNAYIPMKHQSPRLRSLLKEHQMRALNFMIEKEGGLIRNPSFHPIWEARRAQDGLERYYHAITGVCEQSPRPMNGGVLADDMGLGKTLSTLSLICHSLDHQFSFELSPEWYSSLKTLIIAPKSAIPGWQHQIQKHIHNGQLHYILFHGSCKTMASSELQTFDVVITTYETLRSDWQSHRYLYRHPWQRIVLDEAHHIRNRESKTSRSVFDLQSQYRWCLTGTPIHNSIDDFGALLAFIAVPKLGEKENFENWVSAPLRKHHANGLEQLRKLIRATCLRRTKASVVDSCPLVPRTERTRSVRLDPEDRRLYDYFQHKAAEKAQEMTLRMARSPAAGSDMNVLSLITFLRLICNHGQHLLPARIQALYLQKTDTFVDWNKVEDNEIMSADPFEDITDDELEADPSSNFSQLSDMADNTPTFFGQGFDGRASISAKIRCLIENLKQERHNNIDDKSTRIEKSVVFSNWTKMLDLIERALQANSMKFARIDGKTGLNGRFAAIQAFEDDPTCTIMLASTGSAAEGIDLVMANHVHLVEPHWNPMVEAQAINRVHRIGQTRSVTITRYVVEDSIEEDIRQVQNYKIRLISQSLDHEAACESLAKKRLEVLRTILSR